MFNKLNKWDTDLFLCLNKAHNSFWDAIMYWASDKLFWFPFYVFLLVLVITVFKKKSVLISLFIAALITASDQLASNLIKNTVKRFRPSHEAALQGLIHISKAGAGGPYGFISSHASNSFALFVFLSLLLPRSYKWLKYILLFWAILVSYSRIYNGVHYPGDVAAAALSGSLLGWLFAKIYFFVIEKNRLRNNIINN